MTKVRTLLVVLGLGVWALGNVYLIKENTNLGLVLSLIGFALTMGGFAIWAELKGRSPAWMILAVFSPIGILPMLFLKVKKKA